MTAQAWTDVLAYLGAEGYDHITADEAVGALVAMNWRPPPSGDVVARTATVLRYRMEDIGLVQEIEGEDGGEIYAGERTYVEAGHILARHLSDDGLLATPGEFISIPVPPSAELIYKVAEAIRDAYADEILKAGGTVPEGTDITDLCGTVQEWHPEAVAALRALGEAQDG